ncbi:MAG: hypothetical protein KDA84_02700 [Planctomycetaceae bacterium]|nr:hypothetical protein [Planctomycetaceae bacterium]
MKTVTDLLNEHDWKQIPNCQGRFMMVEQQPGLSITDLLGEDCDPIKVSSVMARDTILIVPLDDGGVISYQRANGGCVHTLNTPVGFRRKLQDLGIDHNQLSN